MKELQIELLLKHKNPQLIPFLTRFAQLIREKEKFILGWKAGNKLFIFPCNADTRNKNAFISLNKSMRSQDLNSVTIINYAISIGADITAEVSEEKIKFNINSNDRCSSNFKMLEKLYSDLYKN